MRYILLRTRFDVDDAYNAMVLSGYIMFVWKDEALQWDPREYRNISRVYVEAKEIWTPSIATLEHPAKPLGDGQVTKSGSGAGFGPMPLLGTFSEGLKSTAAVGLLASWGPHFCGLS